MMEYTSKYWNMLTPLIKKSLRKRYGKAKTTQFLRKTNQIYRDMLRRVRLISERTTRWRRISDEGLSFSCASGMRRTDRFLWMNCVQSQRR